MSCAEEIRFDLLWRHVDARGTSQCRIISQRSGASNVNTMQSTRNMAPLNHACTANMHKQTNEPNETNETNETQSWEQPPVDAVGTALPVGVTLVVKVRFHRSNEVLAVVEPHL